MLLTGDTDELAGKVTDSSSEDEVFVNIGAFTEATVAATNRDDIGTGEITDTLDDITDTIEIKAGDMPVITNSSSIADADTHWFITGSIGQSNDQIPSLTRRESTNSDR
ncbi:hypothetical protein [Colwellia sp. MB02u-10]|uniref:hypothetical protein n=1 Tax=Colwellia sp. MB02u-10 TaxID=2759828 RepID=UPI001C711D96|nr:hypothetical protein [Colwellia sp. MB02u-10]